MEHRKIGRRPLGRLLPLLLALVLLVLPACDRDETRPAVQAKADQEAMPGLALALREHLGAPPPPADPQELGRRFGRTDAPPARPAPPEKGDWVDFQVMDVTTSQVRTVRAELRHVTDHAYFFFDQSVDTDPAALQQAGRDFEEKVYPTVTSLFGPVPSPGVDGDPRIYLLHTRLNGASGYVNMADQYPRALMPYSNEREIIYVDSQSTPPGSASYPELLAHELQHLSHLQADPDEEAWINEGLSEIAREQLRGSEGGSRGPVDTFLSNPDIQLNAWPTGGSTTGHYGASHLFLRYLTGRFGGQRGVQELASVPEDGLQGINRYLDIVRAEASLDQIFADWTVANFVHADTGPYGYDGTELPDAALTTRLTEPDTGSEFVHQLGTDYIEVKLPKGDATFHFQGDLETTIAPQPPGGGTYWWSGRGDMIDSRLTREFDLTNVDAANLRFLTWYDIEEGWDYAYVSASTDGGQTWQALPGRLTTTYDPVGHAYGPGYTGSTGFWVDETVNLSAFAGSRVLLRFEYVTDGSTHGVGFAVHNIRIPEIGFEDDGTGWEKEGFSNIGSIPQRFLVQVIRFEGDSVNVEQIPLGTDNTADIQLKNFGAGLDRAVIAVSGATPSALQSASYRYRLELDE